MANLLPVVGHSLPYYVTIVISGFVGRYIYTRVPRKLDGTELAGAIPQKVLRRTRQLIALWHTINIPIGVALFVSAFFQLLSIMLVVFEKEAQ